MRCDDKQQKNPSSLAVANSMFHRMRYENVLKQKCMARTCIVTYVSAHTLVGIYRFSERNETFAVSFMNKISNVSAFMALSCRFSHSSHIHDGTFFYVFSNDCCHVAEGLDCGQINRSSEHFMIFERKRISFVAFFFFVRLSRLL